MIAALLVLLIVAAGLVALRFRDLGRDRDQLAADGQVLTERLQQLEDVSRQQHEDLVVLTHVILERGVADEDDLEELRYRYVELPTRRAEERRELQRAGDLDDEDEIFVDDGDATGTLH